MVRAGRYGEQEATALEKEVVTIGWEDLKDLSSIKTKEKLEKLYWKTYPDATKRSAANEIGQIWRFIHDIKKGDLVALPLKTQSAIVIGKVKDDYEYTKLAENVKHIRKVKWLKTIPRSAFDQDLLYSLGAAMTVCQISRNDAEQRIKKLLDKKEFKPSEERISEEIEEKIDIETYAKDELIKLIDRKFKGHDLARLVDAVLKAQGYTTKMSPPGPDGGVDILASGGALGFDEPKICIQVKSSSSVVDVPTLGRLKGSMSDVDAKQGLLVSWSGFNRKVEPEIRRDFFTIRLWDSGKLLEQIFKYYDKFDDELKAELPLKRIWALVSEEE